MSDHSKIEWTDASWNSLVAYGERLTADATGYAPHRGWHCEHVSQGCANCYAETINRRLGTGKDYKPGHRPALTFALDEKTLLAPLHWRRPRKIFVGSMTDLFGDWVTDAQLDRIFAVMALAPQHTFQVLTKRAERMRAYMGDEGCDLPDRSAGDGPRLSTWGRVMLEGMTIDRDRYMAARPKWPLPNVWLGVSCEDQASADERIPLLLDTPVAVRFVSAEPLLGAIDLEAMPFPDGDARHKWSALTGQAIMYGTGVNGNPDMTIRIDKPMKNRLDWIIAGGESGPHARPMHPDWARKIRDDCAAAGTAFFFKQWGEWRPFTDAEDFNALAFDGRGGKPAKKVDANMPGVEDSLVFRVGKKRAGRLLDGVEHNEFPECKA